MNHGGHTLCPAIRGICWVSLGKLRQGGHVTSPTTQGRGLAGLPGPRGFGEKGGHSLQQGTARARPCPRAQVGPRAGAGHKCGCTHVCSQDLPARPCLPAGEHVCCQHHAAVPTPVTRPLQGSVGPNGAWHRRFPAGHWGEWVLCWEWGGPVCRLGALGVLCTRAGSGVSCTGLRHGHAGLSWDGVLGLTGVLHAVYGLAWGCCILGWTGGTLCWLSWGCSVTLGWGTLDWAELGAP